MLAKELAKKLGVGIDTARQLMSSPGFPAVKIRKTWVVTEEAFTRWYRLNEGRAVLQPQPGQLAEKRGMHKVWDNDWSNMKYPGRRTAT